MYQEVNQVAGALAKFGINLNHHSQVFD